jgi:drug/metabolite transporter (DMT)-like permease
MSYQQHQLSSHTDVPLKGIAFAAIAFFLLAVMNMLAKILSADHHIIEIAFYRNLISVIPFLAYILISKRYELFRTNKPKVLLARSIIGTVSLVTTFSAFAALPMAEVTVLLFTTTLMTPALAALILKEKVGIHRWSAIGIGLIGTAIMVGLQGFTGSAIGILIAVAAAIMHAFLGLLLRIMKTESPITVTFYFVLTGLILTGLCMPFIASVPTPFSMLLLICTGMAGGVAQLCLSLAYKNAPAAVVAPLNYTGLIWATGFDIIIWHFVPGWPVFAGAVIIIAANSYVIYRERRIHKMVQAPIGLGK